MRRATANSTAARPGTRIASTMRCACARRRTQARQGGWRCVGSCTHKWIHGFSFDAGVPAHRAKLCAADPLAPQVVVHDRRTKEGHALELDGLSQRAHGKLTDGAFAIVFNVSSVDLIAQKIAGGREPVVVAEPLVHLVEASYCSILDACRKVCHQENAATRHLVNKAHGRGGRMRDRMACGAKVGVKPGNQAAG
eukprot:3234202-Prymnesium_polylepis.2